MCIRDSLRIGISQQRKFDFVPLGKIREDRWTIVAYCSQMKPLLFEPIFGVLQLHELRFAEGSPIGGAKKQKDSALRPFEGLVGLCMAELIGKSERRRRLTDLQANRRRNRPIGWRAFLPNGKTEESGKEEDGNRNFHFGSRFRFRCLPVRAGTATPSIRDLRC